MGQVYPEITPEIAEFLARQSLFFVATSPLAGDGHINLSPKGYNCFRVVSPTEVAFVDYAGSGAETIAHLRENQRICLMFCSFDEEPKIIRLHGRGRVREPQDEGFADALVPFHIDTFPRSIIQIEVTRVASACGYAVPMMTLVAERDVLRDTWTKRGKEGYDAYQLKNNRQSIDDLPALRWVENTEL